MSRWARPRRGAWIFFVTAIFAFLVPSTPVAASSYFVEVESEWSFTVAETETVYIYGNSNRECNEPGADPYLWLYDSSGTLVAQNDDGNHGVGQCVSSKIVRELQPGDYTIRAGYCCSQRQLGSNPSGYDYELLILGYDLSGPPPTTTTTSSTTTTTSTTSTTSTTTTTTTSTTTSTTTTLPPTTTTSTTSTTTLPPTTTTEVPPSTTTSSTTTTTTTSSTTTTLPPTTSSSSTTTTTSTTLPPPVTVVVTTPAVTTTSIPTTTTTIPPTTSTLPTTTTSSPTTTVPPTPTTAVPARTTTTTEATVAPTTTTIPRTTTTTTNPVRQPETISENQEKIAEAAAVTAKIEDDELAGEVFKIIAEEEVTVEDIKELVNNDNFDTLDDDQIAIIAEALNDESDEVKEVFEGEVNIFDGATDEYVPSGSTVSVAERRIIIAATAVVMAVPMPAPKPAPPAPSPSGPSGPAGGGGSSGGGSDGESRQRRRKT